jgi:PmbA protein
MNSQQAVEYILDTLKKRGVDKIQCTVMDSEKKELNIDAGEMSLFRTIFNSSVYITIYKDNCKGSTSINKVDKESIDTAIKDVIELANSSEPDEAYDIADSQAPKSFSTGQTTADMDNMYDRLSEFSDYTKSTYPKVILEQAIIDFTYRKGMFANSNGVQFNLEKGIYNFTPIFTSKDGTNTSSANGTGFSAKELDRSLKDYGSIDRLLKESEEQVISQKVPRKMNGQIIVTPDCLDDFVSPVMDFVTDIPLISGRSVYKDKLNGSIADSRFTMHSKPRSDELQSNYFITGDGYESQNCTLIENGILKTFLLGIYGANKTGFSRSVNDGGAHIVDGGNVAFDDLVKSMEKGIILSRFSGGNPSDNGDFSGVAKNSYYVEDGEVKFPISETMISGNICSMMNNIVDISKERVDFGDCIYPWIQFDGITIS